MRQFKKTCSLVLAAALTLGLCTTGQTADMKAKKKSAKVSYVKVTNVRDGKLKIQKGKSFRLKTAIKVSPNKKKNRKLKFSSSNKKVIFVSSKGKIKAKKSGKAKITVKSVADPKKKAVISVTVTKDILVKSISLNKTNVVTDENNEDGIQLSVTKILPANAKNKDVEWDTSDDDIADVDDDGLVNINGAGTVTITCFAADDGGASATCKIKVKEVDGESDDASEAPVPAVPDAPAADPIEEPKTAAPVTEVPKTAAPVTEEPKTAAPVTEAPTTDAPATVAPATEAPETAIPEPAAPSSATPISSNEPSESVEPDIPAPIESDTPDVPDETATPEPVSDSYTVTPEMFDEEMSDISSKDISVCKDANGREYMQIKFSKRNQYAFFKLPEPIDLSDYKNVQIVANVPGQLMFCTFDETLDKQTASWWTKSQFVTYPFYRGSYLGRLEDGTAAGVMGIERQIYALSSIKRNDTGLPATYVAIGTVSKPTDDYDFDEVVYDIHSIKFFNEDQDDDWQVTTSPAPSKMPATEAPTTTPRVYDENLADQSVSLDAEHLSPWSTNGDYGQVKFNSDGSVTFSSQPTAYAKDDDGNVTDKVKPVSVYNNGCSFYIGEDADTRTDLSDYHYVAIRLKTKTDAHDVKIMTWAGSDDADNFWEKSDTWGNTTAVVDNADGSSTYIYDVVTLFGKKANKAKAIGFTLKSNKEGTTGNDDGDEEAKEAEVYSITFTNKLLSADPILSPSDAPDPVSSPSAAPEPTATPVIETVAMNLSAASSTLQSDVTPVDGVIPFTKQYQSVFYDIPEDINLAQVTQVIIKADVPDQLGFTLWNNTLDQSAKSWWSSKSFTAFVTYPFYDGSCTDRKADGAFGGEQGEETLTYDIAPNWTVAGNGGYFSIASNQKVEEGDVYKVLSVELVIDHSKAKIDSVVDPTPATAAPITTAVPATAAPSKEPSAEPTAAPSIEPSTEPATAAPITTAAPSAEPTAAPITTAAPATAVPSIAPITTAAPETRDPEATESPTPATAAPSKEPSAEPTEAPITTAAPSAEPSAASSETSSAETPEINVVLTNDNVLCHGDVPTQEVTVNDDDSVSYTSSNKYGGGFIFKTEGLDVTDYAKAVVKVKATTEVASDVIVNLRGMTGTSFWSGTTVFEKYSSLSGEPDEDGYYTVTFDLSAVTGAVDGIGVLVNAYDEKWRDNSVTLTIKSIKLIPAE